MVWQKPDYQTPDKSGCKHLIIAQGRTIAETIEIAEDVARKIIESQIEHNEPIPESLISVQATNFRFNTKIPVPLEA